MIPRGQKRGEKWRNGIGRQAKELRAERERSQAPSSAPSPHILRALPLRGCRMRVVSSNRVLREGSVRLRDGEGHEKPPATHALVATTAVIAAPAC